MGIDIYARWDDQTEAEYDAQITGFDVTAGAVGYLREAYHGEPYATRVLVPEAFSEDQGGEFPWIERAHPRYPDEIESTVAIPSAVLRERLPAALAATRKRYDSELADKACASFESFVALVERLEQEGRRPTIYASW